MNYANDVRAFVVKNFLYGDATPLTDSGSFLGEGILDSTGILELVMYLESTFNIKIETAELRPDNLDSINNVVRFLEAKLGTSPADVPVSPAEESAPFPPVLYAPPPASPDFEA